MILHSKVPSRLSRLRQFVRSFLSDQQGSYIVFFAIFLPALVSLAGLTTEGGFWFYRQRALQSAADNAAFSAATAIAIDPTSDYTLEAKAASASSYLLVDGQNNVTVTVNKPPLGTTCLSGTSHYVNDPEAIEVIVTQSVARTFSHLLFKGNQTLCGRAVAKIVSGGDCVLALGATGTTIQGTKNNTNNLNLDLQHCSIFSDSTSSQAISIKGNNNVIKADTIGSVGSNPGISLTGANETFLVNQTTGDATVPDPYATAAKQWPQTCSTCPTFPASGSSPYSPPLTNKIGTLSPGNYPNGISLNTVGSTINMQAGVYYVGTPTATKAISLAVAQNVIVRGTAGVTLVLLGKNTVITAGNNSEMDITAPTSGATEGIAVWEPQSTGTNSLGGNSFIANFTGVIYTPKAEVDYAGNTGSAAVPNCLQIVASTIKFGGQSINLTGNCSKVPGLKQFGQLVSLLE
jgi:Flp pilus assembly protein TadG